MTSMDEPRPNFRGSMGYDAISGKLQPQSPRYFTYIKVSMRRVVVPLLYVSFQHYLLYVCYPRRYLRLLELNRAVFTCVIHFRVQSGFHFQHAFYSTLDKISFSGRAVLMCEWGFNTNIPAAKIEADVS